MKAIFRPSLTTAEASPFCDLIEQLAERGDRAAFAQLFDHFAPRVKAHLQRLGEAPDAAEATAIEVMLAVRRQAHRFDRRELTPETFIFRVLRNRRLQSLRRPPSLRPVPTPSTVLEGEASAHAPLGLRTAQNAIAISTPA